MLELWVDVEVALYEEVQATESGSVVFHKASKVISTIRATDNRVVVSEELKWTASMELKVEVYNSHSRSHVQLSFACINYSPVSY